MKAAGIRQECWRLSLCATSSLMAILLAIAHLSHPRYPGPNTNRGVSMSKPTSVKVVNRKGGYFIESPPRDGAKLIAGVLLFVWLGAVILSLSAGNWGEAALWTLFVGMPAFAISHLWGSPKRTRILAVLDARQVAGGVHLNVMDANQVAHQVVVDEAISQGLAHVLTGRTGIDA